MTEQVEAAFIQNGGQFITPADQIAYKLKNEIKAFIFDWDGVFNDGFKGPDKPSLYSEANAMGTNMLRFGYWLTHSEILPFAAIITGGNNSAALHFAEREHFQVIYFKLTNKALAISQLEKDFGILPEQVAFCFDDILDLPIAEKCGLRFMVRRQASPLFNQYVSQRNLCDYITASEGHEHAVREIAELILGLLEIHETVFNERSSHSAIYNAYLKQRNTQKTRKQAYNGEELGPAYNSIGF